jgi:hypothetical protein
MSLTVDRAGKPAWHSPLSALKSSQAPMPPIMGMIIRRLSMTISRHMVDSDVLSDSASAIFLSRSLRYSFDAGETHVIWWILGSQNLSDPCTKCTSSLSVPLNDLRKSGQCSHNILRDGATVENLSWWCMIVIVRIQLLFKFLSCEVRSCASNTLLIPRGFANPAFTQSDVYAPGLLPDVLQRGRDATRAGAVE